MDSQDSTNMDIDSENAFEEKIDVQDWLNKISKAREKEQTWRLKAKRIVNAYRDDKDLTSNTVDQGSNYDRENPFNILFANTETLLPALFSSLPKPDVRNRYLLQDKVTQKACQVIERCLIYSVDTCNFKEEAEAFIKDCLLTGRGIPRIRLYPKFETRVVPVTDPFGQPMLDPMGQPMQTEEEVLIGQKVSLEVVPWESFTIDPVKRYKDVSWMSFTHPLTKEEYEESFPGKPLPAQAKDQDKALTETLYDVHEIWVKKKKKGKEIKQVLFICQADEPLKVMGDPLKLENFWPIPEPLYSIKTTNTLVPKPEYLIYENQALELCSLTFRINDLIRTAKIIGVYDSGQTEIKRIFDARESQFVPITTNAMREKGLDGIIDFLDISSIAAFLRELFAYRDQAKSVIYEVTGISDILRGETQASETATAQDLKSRYAGLRLRNRRENINRIIVEILRMMTEVIFTFFPIKQIEEMSGIKLDYSMEPPLAPPQAPMQPQAGLDPMTGMAIQPSPETLMQYQNLNNAYQMQLSSYQMEMEKREEAAKVLEILQSDILRCYKIDIETDSTVLADMEAEAQKRAILVESITKFIQMIAPLVQQGAMPLETAKALLNYALQPTKISRELQDAIDMIGSTPPVSMMGTAPMQGGGQSMPIPQGQPPVQNQPQGLPEIL